MNRVAIIDEINKDETSLVSVTIPAVTVGKQALSASTTSAVQRNGRHRKGRGKTSSKFSNSSSVISKSSISASSSSVSSSSGSGSVSVSDSDYSSGSGSESESGSSSDVSTSGSSDSGNESDEASKVSVESDVPNTTTTNNIHDVSVTEKTAQSPVYNCASAIYKQITANYYAHSVMVLQNYDDASTISFVSSINASIKEIALNNPELEFVVQADRIVGHVDEFGRQAQSVILSVFAPKCPVQLFKELETCMYQKRCQQEQLITGEDMASLREIKMPTEWKQLPHDQFRVHNTIACTLNTSIPDVTGTMSKRVCLNLQDPSTVHVTSRIRNSGATEVAEVEATAGTEDAQEVSATAKDTSGTGTGTVAESAVATAVDEVDTSHAKTAVASPVVVEEEMAKDCAPAVEDVKISLTSATVSYVNSLQRANDMRLQNRGIDIVN